MDSTKPVTLNKQLASAVIELVDFYSKKGVFKVAEYKDIATIDERLKKIIISMENDSPYEDLTSNEYAFIILIFKEGTQRIPTSIDSFGQLYSIYQHFQSLHEIKVKEEENATKQGNLPTVEELEEN